MDPHLRHEPQWAVEDPAPPALFVDLPDHMMNPPAHAVGYPAPGFDPPAYIINAPATAQSSRTRECNNCGEEVPPHRWPRASASSKCEHANHACKDCWKGWLNCQLDYHGADRLSCISCRVPLTQQDVRAFAGVEVFAKHLDLTAKHALAAAPDFHWCLNAKCKSGQFHHGSHGFECGACKHRHCTTCKLPGTIAHRNHCRDCGAPHHEGKTCEEGATAHSKDERATAEAMKELAKKCPGCERRIEMEDDGGCDWISCTKCQHEFCWVCLASHKEIKSRGNEAHKEDCTCYSVGEPLSYPFANH